MEGLKDYKAQDKVNQRFFCIIQFLDVKMTSLLHCLLFMLIAFQTVGSWPCKLVGVDEVSMDRMAQATCMSLQTQATGWMYAVKRYRCWVDCGLPDLTCRDICQDGSLRIQDPDVIDHV